jgi:hypothetical protein
VHFFQFLLEAGLQPGVNAGNDYFSHALAAASGQNLELAMIVFGQSQGKLFGVFGWTVHIPSIFSSAICIMT